MPHVLISPFGIYEVLAEMNRERKGRMEMRVGTSGKREIYSKLNIARSTAGDMVANMDTSKASGYEANPERNTRPNVRISTGKFARASKDGRCVVE